MVTCFRQHLLEPTLKSIRERTRFPYRLIVVNNGTAYSEQYKNEVIKADVLIETGANIGFGAGMNEGFKHVTSKYFVTTCDDIFPPDIEPCWLERLAVIFDLHPEYGGINSRCQRMTNYHFDDESQQVYEHRRTLASSFRIQRKADIEKLGGVPIGSPYESKAFTRAMYSIGLKCGCATHIHCDHVGHALENKGYPKGFVFQFQKNTMRPLPEIEDHKTNTLFGHTCPLWPYDD